MAAFLGAILSQELSIVLGFPLVLAYVLFGKRETWGKEINLGIAAILVVSWTALNIAVFQVRTMTILDGVSPNVEAGLAPNFSQPLNYLSVFLSYSRLHLPLSILLAVGFLFTLKDSNRSALAVLIFFISGIVFTNLLVTAVSLRYQYWLIPIWILLGLQGLRALMSYWTSDAKPSLGMPLAGAMATLLFAAIVASWSPWRIPASYDAKILGDASGAFAYIRTHLRSDDAVAATEPHPHGMLLETGRSDYDIAFPTLFDFAYNREGALVDRNGGATVISSVEDLQTAFARHDRLWIAINREKFRTRGKNLRWEYPGARAEHFLRSNCSIEWQGYLWTVFLWDAEAGQYQGFRQDWSYAPPSS